MLPSIFGESLFDDWMGFPFRGFESDVDRKLYGKHAAHVMKTDLKDLDDHYELEVDLPGFKKDQIDLQLQNFEFYLADQYDVAKAAKLETLSDGTILMVMCEGSDTVFNAIKTAIEGAY